MYTEPKSSPQPQPEHLKLSLDMAHRIMEFPPDEQNEIVINIRAEVFNNRESQIAALYDNLEYLKGTLDALKTL